MEFLESTIALLALIIAYLALIKVASSRHISFRNL